MPKKKKSNAKWFYIVAGALAATWMLGKVSDRGDSSSANRVSAAAPARSTPVPTPWIVPSATPNVSRYSVAQSIPTETPRPPVSPISTQLEATALVLTPTPTPAVALIKEPNPPSDKYVPPFVKLTSPVSFPKYQGGTQVGLVAAPIGTKVKLVRITGLNVLINHDGQTISIPATSTDLLERMLGTAED